MSIPPGLLAQPVADPQARAARIEAERTLVRAVHHLADATLRTRLSDDELAALTTEVQALTARLSTNLIEGALGLRRTAEGRLHDPGNPMTGHRNAFAPPLDIDRDYEKHIASAAVTLGALYEGPPTCVHGGISAAMLDQVLGAAATTTGKPGMTAYLNVTYRQPTFLFQRLTIEARVTEMSQWKSLVHGEIRDAQGHVTVEAEGLFVVPKMARDLLAAAPLSDAP